MPLIEVHLIEKVFSPEQKRQIIHKLTDAMVSIEGENMRGVTWVKGSEVASGEWGIGGQPLTTEAVEDPRRRPTRGVTCSFLADIASGVILLAMLADGKIAALLVAKATLTDGNRRRPPRSFCRSA